MNNLSSVQCGKESVKVTVREIRERLSDDLEKAIVVFHLAPQELFVEDLAWFGDRDSMETVSCSLKDQGLIEESSSQSKPSDAPAFTITPKGRTLAGEIIDWNWS